MAMNQKTLQKIEDEWEGISEEIKRFLEKAKTEEGTGVEGDLEIAISLADALANKFNTYDNEVRNKEPDGIDEFQNAQDIALELAQKEVVDDESAIAEFKTVVEELKEAIDKMLADDLTELHDIISDDKDDFDNLTNRIEKSVEEASSTSADGDKEKLENTKIELSIKVDDFEKAIVYNKEFSRKAGDYLDPLKIDLINLSEELESIILEGKNTMVEHAYSELKKADNDAERALIWYESWEKR
ncbi:hypothetical protein [Staphylococcus haemolyticus]|uniref:hypothetical protein n=1 Tax=Staphylococcus haemolyticus TaxID=1283 RepID=UPI001F0A3398|nr:hypothetical protein [Staphylococcus haemolyticus]MCH4446782.1 hypothetical protein [Staphylococcus haemolyticus]